MSNENNSSVDSEIVKKVFEIICSNPKLKISDEVDLDTDFTSFDLDSITFIETVITIEHIFDFEFDDEMLFITKFPTIKALVEYVEAKTKTNENP